MSRGVIMDKLILADFLVTARMNCYAIIDDISKITLPDGGTELIYNEGELLYRDRYYGGEPFIGEEVVMYKGNVIWGMNLRGKVIKLEVIPTGEIYSFVREALRAMQPENPYRGPSHFQSHDLQYSSKSTGTIENFHGVEEIIYKGEIIYEGFYHGGSVGLK
jgi:hypothetical protein